MKKQPFVHAQYAQHDEIQNLCCHLQLIPPVQMSKYKHFVNPASLTYQICPCKETFLSLLRDTEKLDEPKFLSCFFTDAFTDVFQRWNLWNKIKSRNKFCSSFRLKSIQLLNYD